MRIGVLRKRVTIQAEQPTSDNAGGYSLAWANVASMWVEIEPLNGNEFYRAQHLEGHVTHRVTMRYRSDIGITTDMRLIYNNRNFNIRSVLNSDERNQWLELLVEEGVAI